MTRIRSILLGVVALSVFTTSARAQFTPGHVFVSETAGLGCKHQATYGSDRIIEIDPKTGESWVFADIPEEWCGIITGLTFTPDRLRLRAASAIQSVIFEFDSDGNRSVALDPTDGIAGPVGWNNLAYNPDGDFFVGNGNATILRFPALGGAAIVYADAIDGVGSLDAIAIAADGDLYWGTLFENVVQVRRITPDAMVSQFDTFGSIFPVVGMTADDADHVYVMTKTGEVVVYQSGDPLSREVLATVARKGSLAMLPDQSKMYYAPFGSLHTIDVVTGAMVSVAELHDLSDPHGRGGIAVVPTVPSDLDRDADVDIDDFVILIGCLSGPDVETDPEQCPRADIDTSGAIDLADFALFQAAFTGQ